MSDSNISHAEINEAIVWALANGSPKGAPVVSMEKMANHYGPERTDVLLGEIRSLVEELMGITVDWQTKSWQEAGDYVRDTMRDRHPYLSEEAAGRLRGYFMYQTR
ncbi:hypothetical protein VST63_23175 [Mycolicibacterium sp. 050232]|uniref:hypothetical protein n=1 Tax=Mycolicibacterium sp. 050232 TaxID=3113982 RepID=UPI002E2AFDFB|nr:hypothetical protein [Mycolicibacterium sp. 050232]MED5815273.1 hypothetical protein [Mycolicibacterium sp. 050232]